MADFIDDPINKKIDPIKLLKQAISAQAPKSVSVILKKFNIAKIDNLIQPAAKDGNLSIVLALCRDDYAKAAGYLFMESSFPKPIKKPALFPFFKPNDAKLKAALYDRLIAMLRFSPIESVDKIVDAYLSGESYTQANKQVLWQCYSEAKTTFFQCAPTFSRYANPIAFGQLTRLYGRDRSATFTEKARNDMEYGKARNQLVQELVSVMRSAMENQNQPITPTRKDLQALPPSPTGSKIFSALLEKIIDYATKNVEEKETSEFYHLNTERIYQTPVTAQYGWGTALIGNIFYHSQSTQVTKGLMPGDHSLYSLTYRESDSVITRVEPDTTRILMEGG